MSFARSDASLNSSRRVNSGVRHLREGLYMKSRTLAQTFLILFLLAGSSVAQSPALSPIADVPTVSYCDLIRNASSYDKKEVRVRAIYAVGFEASFLYDSACSGKAAAENRVWVEFSDVYEKSSKPEVVKKFDRLLKPLSKANRYDAGRVEIVVVGKFDGVRQTGELKLKDRVLTFSVGYGHLDSYDYQITVESIEEVKSVPKNAPW
jgi:hypothetical protein